MIRSKLKHIYILQFLSIIGFAVIYSTLVLFLIQDLRFTEHQAYKIFGSFLFINFLLNIFAGYIGQRWINFKLLFLFSMLIQSLGFIILSYQNAMYLLAGLAFIVFSTGMMMPCLTMLITLYCKEDKHRQYGFIKNYGVMNVGFFIGYLLSGYFEGTQEYSRLFLVSSVIGMVCFIYTAICYKKIEVQKIENKTIGATLFIISFILSIAVAYFLFDHHGLINVLSIISIIILIFFGFRISRSNSKNSEKNQRYHLYIILCIFGMIFWSFYYLTPMIITIFVKKYVAISLIGVQIEPQYFGTINATIVIISAIIIPFVFEKLKIKKLNIPKLFTLGFIFMAISIIFLILAMYFTVNVHNKSIASVCVISFYVFISIGEILILPVGYSMIGQLIEKKYQGMTMGVWMYLCGSIAGVSSSKMSQWIPDVLLNPTLVYKIYISFFIVSLMSAFLLYKVGNIYRHRNIT